MRDRVIGFLSSSRSTLILGWATALLTASVVAFAVVFGPGLLSSTDAVRESIVLETCRAEYGADRDRSIADLQQTQLQVQLAVAAGFRGIVEDDDVAVRASTAALRELDLQARRQLVSLRDAGARYEEALVSSREAPDEFIEDCQ